MKHLVLFLAALLFVATASASNLTTQRVQNGRVISVGDSLMQIQQARPQRRSRSGNAYGWPVDGNRYLWATVRNGRVCTLRVVDRRRR